MIYFIVEEGDEYVKIGYSRKPLKRIVSIMHGNPRQLSIALIIDGGMALERALHERFKETRVNGEWFEMTDEIRHVLREDAIGNTILADVRASPKVMSKAPRMIRVPYLAPADNAIERAERLFEQAKAAWPDQAWMLWPQPEPEPEPVA